MSRQEYKKSRLQRRPANFPRRFPHLVLTAILFAIFAIVSYVTPFGSDDWLWAVHGFDRMETLFAGYGNGRYLGNLIITYIMQFGWLRVLIEATVNTALIMTMIAIVRQLGQSSFLKAAIVVLFTFTLIPVRVYRETFFWTAGFANYNTSALTLLLVVLIFLPLFLRRDAGKGFHALPRYITVPSVLLLAFASQLFLENSTIFLVAFAFFTLAWAIWHKRDRLLSLALTVGASLGAFIMFSHPAYKGIFEGERDIYSRTVGTDFFASLVELYPTSGMSHIFLQAALIFILLSFVLTFTMQRTVLQKVLNVYCVMFSAGLLFWTHLSGAVTFDNFPAVGKAAAIASLLFIVAVVICLALQKTPTTTVLSLTVLAGFCLALMIFVQDTFGLRNILMTFLFINLVSASLILSIKRIPKIAYVSMLAVTLAFALVVGYGLHSNHQVSKSREIAIAYAIENQSDSIELERYRFPSLGILINNYNPDHWWGAAMKMYYGIDPDVELIFYER